MSSQGWRHSVVVSTLASNRHS